MSQGAEEPGRRKKGEEPPARRRMRLPTSRQVGFFLFGLLLAMAAAFYVWWCFSFHVCADNGEYAIVATLSGFGLAGMWVTLPPKPRAA